MSIKSGIFRKMHDILLFSLIFFVVLLPLIDSNPQHAGARDEKGTPIIKDFYSSPLTARFFSPEL